MVAKIIDESRHFDTIFMRPVDSHGLKTCILCENHASMRWDVEEMKSLLKVILMFICNDIFVYYSGSDVVRGYDFLVNSVWPEVVSNIEARTSSIFAPGNPDIFHAVGPAKHIFRA